MAALFGNSSGNSRREPRSLLEFRAGKMKLTGTTVSADTRKGLVYVKLEDGLLHFCWKDRKSGEIVDDFIIFPGDAELKRVSQCTTGRVVLLKFKDTSRKFFYWLQEPKEEKDEDYLKKVNDLIEHPPNPSQAEAMISGNSGFPGGLGGLQAQNLLGGVAGNPQLLEQLISSGAFPPPGMLPMDALSGRGLSQNSAGRGQQQSSPSPSSSHTPHSSSSSAAVPPAPTSQSQPPQSQRGTSAQQRGHAVQLGDLQNILSTMNIPSGSDDGENKEDSIGLNDVVTPDVLRPLSGDDSVQEQLQPHVPQTSESMADVLTSPQFQQALGVFGSALQSGQLGPLMSQFGMGQAVVNAANSGRLDEFASALEQGEQSDGQEQAVDQSKGKGSTEKDEDKSDEGTA